VNYENPFVKEFRCLFSKFGLKISNNFQTEPLAKSENSIKFLPSKFVENTLEVFHNSRLATPLKMYTKILSLKNKIKLPAQFDIFQTKQMNDF